MIDLLLADASISIGDLKKNPGAAIRAAEGSPLAVLHRNRPAAYLVPADFWEALLERFDDFELSEIVRQRENSEPIEVSLGEL